MASRSQRSGGGPSGGRERFRALDLVRYYARVQGVDLKSLRVPPTVVISWAASTAAALAEAASAGEHVPWLYGQAHKLWRGKVGKRPVAVFHMPVGAAATVMMMEELMACGARTFIGCGTAGSLTEKARIGSLLLASAAVSDEGTSRHYGKATGPRRASERLVLLAQHTAERHGFPVVGGRLWTTDAPYRELRGRIQDLRRGGVVGVDMETSAVYAAATFRGAEAANVLAVSDELWTAWRPGFRSDELKRGREQAVQLVMKMIAADKGRGAAAREDG